MDADGHRLVEGAPVCDPCYEGDHERCAQRGCMCIDMEHDADGR